jgi:hypothetical protein
MSSTILVKF